MNRPTKNPHKNVDYMKKAMKESLSPSSFDYKKFYNDINYVSPGVHAKKFYSTCMSLLESNGFWLDLGCGTASYISDAIKEKNISLYGIEVVEKSVEIANKNGVKCVEGSVSDPFPFEDSMFDLVSATDVLEHLHPNDVESTLTNSFRVCKKGGHAVFAPYTKPDATGLIHLTVKPTSWWIKQCEKAGFTFIKRINDYGILLSK